MTEEFSDKGPSSIAPNVFYVLAATNQEVLDSFIFHSGVEGEVDTDVIPPLPGHSAKGPPRSSTFGKVPLDDATPL